MSDLAMTDDLRNAPSIVAPLSDIPRSSAELMSGIEGLALPLMDTSGGGHGAGPLGGQGVGALPRTVDELAGGLSGVLAGANLGDYRDMSSDTRFEVGLPDPLPFNAQIVNALAGKPMIVHNMPGDGQDEGSRAPHHSIVVALDPAAYFKNPIFGVNTIAAELSYGFPCFVSNERVSAGHGMPRRHVRNIASINAALFKESFPLTDYNSLDFLAPSATSFCKLGQSGWFNESLAAAVAERYGNERMDAVSALSGPDWTFIGVCTKRVSEGNQPMASFSTIGIEDMVCIWPSGQPETGRVHPQPGAVLWLVLVMRYWTDGETKSYLVTAADQRMETEKSGHAALPLSEYESRTKMYFRWEPHVTEGHEPPLVTGASGPMGIVMKAVRVGVVVKNPNTPERLANARHVVEALLYPSSFSTKNWTETLSSPHVPTITVMLESAWNGVASVAPSRTFSTEIVALRQEVNDQHALPRELLHRALFSRDVLNPAAGRRYENYTTLAVLNGVL